MCVPSPPLSLSLVLTVSLSFVAVMHRNHSLCHFTCDSTCLVEQKRIIQQLDDVWNASSNDVKDSYSLLHKDSVVKTLHTMLRLTHHDISPVIDALTTAVTCSREPDHHYRLSSFAESILFYLNETLPSEITDDYLAPLLISPTVSFVTCINQFAQSICTLNFDKLKHYRNKSSQHSS